MLLKKSTNFPWLTEIREKYCTTVTKTQIRLLWYWYLGQSSENSANCYCWGKLLLKTSKHKETVPLLLIWTMYLMVADPTLKNLHLLTLKLIYQKDFFVFFLNVSLQRISCQEAHESSKLQYLCCFFFVFFFLEKWITLQGHVTDRGAKG